MYAIRSYYVLRVETVEGCSVVLALAQHGVPGEAGLRSLEDEKLEEPPVVVDRHTPLLVVVGGIVGLAQIDPGTASYNFV